MLVWPRKGEPVVVLDSFAEKVVARDSWIGKTVVYKAYVESLYTRVANVLDDLGLSKVRPELPNSTKPSASRLQSLSADRHVLGWSNCSSKLAKQVSRFLSCFIRGPRD